MPAEVLAHRLRAERLGRRPHGLGELVDPADGQHHAVRAENHAARSTPWPRRSARSPPQQRGGDHVRLGLAEEPQCDVPVSLGSPAHSDPSSRRSVAHVLTRPLGSAMIADEQPGHRPHLDAAYARPHADWGQWFRQAARVRSGCDRATSVGRVRRLRRRTGWRRRRCSTPSSGLALAANGTSARSRLGTAVVPTWTRHPQAMAAAALTAQAATGGRFVLGIGLLAPAGGREATCTWRGSKPIRHMLDYLDVLQPLLDRGRGRSRR